MEIAAELGLIDQIQSAGWHSLSAKDAGRIGGLMTQRRRKNV
ncbi:small, acid-soluble spore protein, alpha/beta type [Desulfosporosinus sp. Sb-LF]|nr:small, acid-soluble spore protein, alpha/beta type [Desulfosporosinus sp. Sb-LF]